jgi:cytochrome c551/c552
MNTFWKTIPWGAVALVVLLITWMNMRPAQATADLTRKHNCVACHAEVGRKVGPAYQDIAKKYASRSDAADYLAKKIRAGGSGVWGSMPMPPHPQVPEADARAMAIYIMGVK